MTSPQRRSSKQREPNSYPNQQIRTRFELWPRKIAAKTIDSTPPFVNQLVLSMSRRARMATSFPAPAHSFADKITAEWPQSNVLAMLVNLTRSRDETFEPKEVKCTIRYSSLDDDEDEEEKSFKVLATCKIDLSRIAIEGEKWRQDVDLPMNVHASLDELISNVTFHATAVLKPLAPISLPAENDDDNLSDISVDDDQEIDLESVNFSATSIPPLTKINYRSRPNVRPKRSSWNSQLTTHPEDGPFTFAGDFDPLGILKVKIIGASSLALPTKLKSSQIGIYCILTINGGFTKTKTATHPYQTTSQAPVVWNPTDAGVIRFYASRSRHLFLLCHAVDQIDLADEPRCINIVDDDVKEKSASKKNCIGVASLPIKDIDIGEEEGEQIMRLEPTGSVYLIAQFLRLNYRHPVSARGRVTLLQALDLSAAESSMVSCFVRIDGKQQGSTNPVALGEKSELSWQSEAIEFLLVNAVDLEIHLWASRVGGYANWCGYGVLPLASCLYEDGDKPAVESLSQCVRVTLPCEKATWIDLEPKGKLLIQLDLNPSQVPFQMPDNPDTKGKIKKRSLPQVGLSKEGKLDVVPTIEIAPVGRSLDNVEETEQPQLVQREIPKERQRKKTASWSELLSLMKDRIELKKENEYLKETVVAVKAELAESEFQREKLAIQNEKLLGLLQKEKRKARTLARTSTSLELQKVMNQI